MNWYKTLTIHQKISFKEMYNCMSPFTWEEMGLLFTYNERIELAVMTLKNNGFIINN